MGKNEKGEPLLSFWLDCQGENTDKLWLLVFMGKAPGTMGDLFCWYDWGSKGIKRREWKSFLSNFFLTQGSLHENGFILNDDGTAIIKPFHLDLDCLKDKFLSPDICFEPLADAIESINSQIKIFNLLANQARKL